MPVPGECGSGSGRDTGTVCPNQTCPPKVLPKGSRTPAQEPQRGRLLGGSWRQPQWEPFSPGDATEGSALLPAFGFITSFWSAHGCWVLLNFR